MRFKQVKRTEYRSLRRMRPVRYVLLRAFAVASLTMLQGCYYVQAIGGHMNVMQNRRPISEILADPDVSAELKNRLAMVEEARRFAIDELFLPDNDSYGSYADLGRDYVVWNVFATPEFSLEPRQWCFPVAGCVAYRGYFARAAAESRAESLERGGYDAAVVGVAAYSTLGRFADPVLNTMMHWSDAQLVAVVFHELAHQVLYVKGDSRFNESFATAIADVGIRRWLTKRDEQHALDSYRRSQVLQRVLMERVESGKIDLARVYDSSLEAETMRREKRLILDRLSEDIAELTGRVNANNFGILAAPLNNATLVSVGLYQGWSGAFRNIYDECAGELRCFYDRSRELAELSHEERFTRMTMLNER
jgi:predicted aminopeptidase